jgi:hypothetical protein
MTNYQDDPNINRRRSVDYGERKSGASMWVAGLAAVAIVVAILAYAVTNNRTTTATNTNPPATTERSTTGSGATAPATTGRANTDQGNPAGGVQTAPPAKPEAREPGSSAPAQNR